jgi:hypothetical protein
MDPFSMDPLPIPPWAMGALLAQAFEIWMVWDWA